MNQPSYPPQGGYPQQQPVAPAGQIPQFYEANDVQAAQGYQQAAQAAATFGPLAPFLRVPGPRGQTKWGDSSVPVGYQGETLIHLLPPWAAGKPVYVEAKTHFYKSTVHPKGTVLGYGGEDSLWLQAVRLAMAHPDPRIQKLANDYGRVRRQWLYNVVDLSNPTTHYGQDGIMRPFILGVGSNLQKDLGLLADTRGGISKLVHPISGRPIRYTKKKTGPEEMNVEYGVLDLDPASLNPYFYPVLEHLWDLEAQSQASTIEDMARAIQEIGFPMPATGRSFGQVPQSYNPNPAPVWANPYPATGGYLAPPPPPMGGQMPQTQWAPPPPPMTPAGMTAGGPPPPPPMGMTTHQQGYMGPPPAMSPPPVSSVPGASGYAPNPGAQGVPPPPPPMGGPAAPF